MGSPAARRRELGSMLRSLRDDAGLTTEQVADWLGASRSKISRLENGRRGASADDIERLCELFHVDDEQRLHLSALAAEGKEPPWWQPLGAPYSGYPGLEAEATSISDYGLALVPGLLQTAEYARALLRADVVRFEPRIVEERVRGRMARQRLLHAEAAPRFDVVLDESVLHRIVDTPAVMRAQLEQLLEMSRLPHVTIRIVPYNAGTVPAGVNKFVILRFAKPDIADVVLIESLTGEMYLDGPEHVGTYSATFQFLTELAADPAASTAMIMTKLITYQS